MGDFLPDGSYSGWTNAKGENSNMQGDSLENKKMESITLKEIAGYLPYELDGEFRLSDVIGERAIKDELRKKILTAESVVFFKSYCKPILYPLSMLTQEIEHNGEKFIPFLELYKMSNEHNYKTEIDYEFVDSWGSGKILKVFHNRDKDEYTEFIYSFKTQSFRKDRRYSEKSNVFGINLPHGIRVDSKTYNQLQMFEKLYEWHFDVHGLIPRGLAIDKSKTNV